MAQGRPVEDKTRKKVLALFDQGMTRNAIAREVKLSGSTVTRICRESGREFDPTKTELAQRARSVELAEARQLLIQKMMVRADELVELMDAPMLVFNIGGKDNTVTEHFVESPTVESMQRMFTMAGIGVDKASRLLDKSDTGADQAAGVLDAIASVAATAAEHYREGKGDEG